VRIIALFPFRLPRRRPAREADRAVTHLSILLYPNDPACVPPTSTAPPG
jgi:hypothetical protein